MRDPLPCLLGYAPDLINLQDANAGAGDGAVGEAEAEAPKDLGPQTISFGENQVTDPRDKTKKLYPWTVTVSQSSENDVISFEVTGIPYTGPKANESYEIYIFLQNPLPYTPPTADVMMLKWSALQGPTALPTVEDHVCIDCISFLKMKDSEPNYKLFLT